MEWTGPLKVFLGTGGPETLNFGSANLKRQPFLYVPLSLSYVRTAIRYLSRNKLAYYIEGVGGNVVSYNDESDLERIKKQLPPGARLIPNPGKIMSHLGETHLTVSQGKELADALGPDPIATLIRVGLFDAAGQGIPTPIKHKYIFRVMRAAYYKDDADPDGPILIAEQVRVPWFTKVRKTLGLSPCPSLPYGRHYIPHITCGFIARRNLIHRSYVDQHRPKTSESHSESESTAA